ncbi:MAG: carboxylating nicotinate-nucleotide diphosphorylase [Longimicrobiales bacterium]
MVRPDTLDTLITLALEEDVGPGDVTTLWTVAENAVGHAVVVAKEPVVVAGMDAALAVFRRVDPTLDLRVQLENGARAAPEEILLRIRGSLRSILTAERVALNFLGRLSGIATTTRRFATEVSGTSATVLDTRKTTPGWRILEKEAVRAGEGGNHRMGLHDMVLVKDNHIQAAGGITAAVEGVRRENRDGLPVEVEVGTLAELDEALKLGVDRILLDNMGLDEMTAAVARTRAWGDRRPELEASGNMTLDRVRAVAETGVDFISVGALTHSAPGADLSLRVLED